MKVLSFILLCLFLVPFVLALLFLLCICIEEKYIRYFLLVMVLFFGKGRTLRVGFLIGFNLYIWIYLYRVQPCNDVSINILEENKEDSIFTNLTKIDESIQTNITEEEPASFAYISHPCGMSKQIGEKKFRVWLDGDCLEKEHQKLHNGR